MSVVTALCDCSALLLLASGPAKVWRPATTEAMLTELRLPAWRAFPQDAVVRGIGVAEIAVAVFVLAAGGVVSAGLLALAFLSFALVALRLLNTASTVDCGCFGRASAPISPAHVAVTAACCACGIAGLFTGIGPVTDLFDPGALLGGVTVVLVATLAGAAYLTITALPGLLRARTS